MLDCDRINISFVSSIRDLGIRIDSKSTFEDNVKYTVAQVNFALYSIYSVRRFTDLNYCSAILLGRGSILNTKLQRLIKKVLRYVLCLPLDPSISQAKVNLD